ncbi:hypothetical protein IQ278_35050, partial [Tolypothrix sp. LEGE 11397]|nr:hypothetical protein [Tolypothrix sp. LEGE 11397]
DWGLGTGDWGDEGDEGDEGDVDAIAVKQCVGRVPRLEATAEPEGLPVGWEMR